MASTTYDFPEHIKGDTFLEQEFIYKRNGVPIDLTGWSIRMMLKLNKKDTTNVLLLSTGSGLTIKDAVNGVLAIDKQIIDIEAHRYVYDVELTDTNNDVFTYQGGIFPIIQDVTS